MGTVPAMKLTSSVLLSAILLSPIARATIGPCECSPCSSGTTWTISTTASTTTITFHQPGHADVKVKRRADSTDRAGGEWRVHSALPSQEVVSDRELSRHLLQLRRLRMKSGLR